MDRHYRKIARRFYRMLRHPRRQRSSAVYRWLGARFFDRRLWVPERHGFAKGMAIGMFFAMTPPFTPQMLCAALVCLWRKWNVPISMAMCWLTNMFTLVPQIYIQTVIGLWVVERFVPGAGKAGVAFDTLEHVFQIWRNDGGLPAFKALQANLGSTLMPLALPYAIGIVLTAIIGAAFCYGLGHLLWVMFAHRVPVKHTVPHRQHPPEG